MADLLTDFERDCEIAGVPPGEALKEGGVHPTLWRKWRTGQVSPTLRNFEAARAGLKKLVDQPRMA